MKNQKKRNGIAIWWDGEQNSDIKIHIDVNVWNTIKTDDVDYIEFGIKITNYKDLQKLYIYLPYKFDDNDIEDKSKNFGDKSFVSALFNENIRITSHEENYTEIDLIEKKEKFYSYRPNLTIEDNILTITPKKFKFGGNYVYYRIRINKIENIFTKVKDNNFFLEGIFREVGFVEFDINSLRRLPDEIADKLTASNKIKFGSMHFYYMTDTNTNMIYHSMPNKNSRILEKHIWDGYLKGKNKSEADEQKIIALHWHQKDSFQDFSLFLKLSYTLRSNLAIYIAYITLLIIGMIGGLSGNYLTDFIKFYFLNIDGKWISWEVFLYGISIIFLVFPLFLFLLLKILYNNWIISAVKNFFGCLSKKGKK